MHPSVDARVRKATLSISLSPPLLGVLVVVTIVIGLILFWQLRPSLYWAYNVRQATVYQATAIDYPEPRQSDSLPIQTNPDSNQAALGHLAAAIRWRPQDPYAYRLAGESYLAAGDLLNAINIMESGMEQAGSDILLGWQLALAYEQVEQQVRDQTGMALVSQLARATPDVPDVPLDTPYCRSGVIGSCYSGKTSFTRPYAAFPSAGKVTVETLFLHPPARVTIPVSLPQGQPVLTFLLGLAPEAQAWGTDGATFQVWVVESDGGILPVYERTVIGGELTKGWVPDQVDLTPWSGQRIQLAFGTTAGPLNDNSGDWVGFGGVLISDPQIAAYRALMAEGRFRNAALNAPITDLQLVSRGDEALYAGRYDEAEKWYRRAEWTGADVTSTLAYARFLEVQSQEGFEAGFPYLEHAVKLDRGWGSPVNRFHAYFNYGRWLTEEQVFTSSEGYLLVALAIFPEPNPSLYASVAEVHRFLSIGYEAQQRWDEALDHALQAVTLVPDSFFTQYQYGLALFRKDPTNVSEVEQAFARALELDQSANSWQTIVLVWLTAGDNERTRSYCDRALLSYTPEQLGYTCWESAGGASAILYNEYLQLLADGNEEGAIAKLEEAIRTNGGWSSAGQRFETWLAWTNYLIREERHEDVISAAQTTLTLVPEYVSDYSILLLNQQIASAYTQLEQYDEALPYYQTAISIDGSAFLYFDYGVALYAANPDDLNSVRTAFQQAVTLAAEEEQMRALQIDFWYHEDADAEAALLCSVPPLTAVEESLCVPAGVTESSGMAFREYLDLVETDEGLALSSLRQSVTLDQGWERLSYRHRAWYEWGRYQSEQGNVDEAIGALRNAIDAKDPRVTDGSRSGAAVLLALLYLENDNLEEAIATYQLAIQLDSENAFAYVNLARAYYSEDNSNLVRVRNLFEQAIQIDPEAVEIWQTVASFWAFVNQPAEVERVCGSAPADIQARMGDLCLSDTDIPSRESFYEFSRLFATDSTAAYEALEVAITTDLGWADSMQRYTAWYFWGVHLLDQQDYPAAAAALEMATVIAPDTVTPRDKSETFRQWGLALFALNDLEEALIKAEEAVSLDPTNAYAHVLFGQLAFRSDTTRRNDADAAFGEALRLEPDNLVLWTTVIMFWLEQDMADSALQLCEIAPPVIREGLGVQCWEGGSSPSATYYDQYREQSAAGQQDAAYTALESAVTVNGGWRNDTERYLAWRDWALYLWQLDRDAEALIAYETTLSIAPEGVDPTLLALDYQIMGFSLIALQRLADAVDAFATAVALDPNNPAIRLQYGYTLYAADVENKSLAAEQFTIALDLAPDQITNWQDILAFWQRNGETGEIELLCQKAAGTTVAAELATYCTAP